MRRMRKTVISLRENLRTLREGQGDPQLLDKAMLAELDALRATRQSEIAEMDEILAELKPLVSEVQHA
jgi:ribosome recycling factor